MSRSIATSHSAGGSMSRDSPTTVIAANARSRRPSRSSIAPMVRETLTASEPSCPVRLRGHPREELVQRAGVEDVRGLDPGASRLR